jgi:hypothetical protein
VADLKPRDGYLTNFLGVVIHCKFLPKILEDRGGQVEGIPIPANWHADIAEWGAALRAVDLAKKTFAMAELGCGWGCWMNNTGVAARRRGLKPYLIGVEGDKGHVAFAREACATNGFGEDKVRLYHGIAAATTGTALFPRQTTSGVEWGLEPQPSPHFFLCYFNGLARSAQFSCGDVRLCNHANLAVLRGRRCPAHVTPTCRSICQGYQSKK